MKKELKKPNIFNFEAYRLNKKAKTISFSYSLDNGLKFTEIITLGSQKIAWAKINNQLLNKILFNLHLALGLSYYKTYCPKKIIITSGQLTKEEANFWNKLYTSGLGEFFYQNKIDFRGLINFPYQKNKKSQASRVNLNNRSLLSWGGGKDSCVSAEILKELGHKFSLISLGDSEVQKASAKISGQSRIILERTIDPKLITLNQQGVYNGHIPISAIYAWVTVLAALLYNYRYLIYSNEASANFGNVNYLGQEINHQYSKSLEFENDFRAYLKNFVTPDINYFSLLRPYSEFKITELFSHYQKYFPAFSSCNRNFSLTHKTKQRWCGECPKCAFVFSQLAAFLKRSELIKIFGKNLLADKKLLPLFQELWGEKRFKPFECVGEPSEVKAALFLATHRQEWALDSVAAYFLKNIAPKIKLADALLNSARKISAAHNVPNNFRKILILGFGHEGHFTAQYLKRLSPGLKFKIADLKDGPKYLETLKNYELIIKTPGLSDRRPEIIAARAAGKTITSLTNIFLEAQAENTIGVTGTKGKSTTASLIYSLLRAGGIKAELVGNIGYDPLKYLQPELINKPSTKKSKPIFVYELSSYQLALAPRSPHLAVFINIFPDHLPYHDGFLNYFQAKANITKHQNKTDYFIYNSDYPLIQNLAKKTAAQTIDYLKKGEIKKGWLYYQQEAIIPLKDLKLLGRHNQENIFAAISVAKLYGLKNATIRKVLKNFSNLEHRLEFVGRYQGIDFYDDAISTTPESTLAAIKVFENKLGTIILGGENRGYNFSALAEKLAALKIMNLVLFPDSGAEIALAIKRAYTKQHLPQPKILPTTSMAAAVKFAYQNTKQDQVCLLSTASPSYSLFKDFKAKGNLFQKAVKNYGKKL